MSHTLLFSQLPLFHINSPCAVSLLNSANSVHGFLGPRTENLAPRVPVPGRVCRIGQINGGIHRRAAASVFPNHFTSYVTRKWKHVKIIWENVHGTGISTSDKYPVSYCAPITRRMYVRPHSDILVNSLEWSWLVLAFYVAYVSILPFLCLVFCYLCLLRDAPSTTSCFQ